jgi:shikimate dehydrogenase
VTAHSGDRPRLDRTAGGAETCLWAPQQDRPMVTGAPRLAAVMGWPIRHSLSPRLHGHWFISHGIEGTYVPLKVRPEDLELAFTALPRLGFLGWNVTLPHKEAAFHLVGHRDAAALRMQAVNTVLVLADGTLEGRNTDGIGFLANLRQQAPDWQAGRGPAVLLGTGGAARAVAVALGDAGVREILLINRTLGRAHALALDLIGGGADLEVEALPWEARGEALKGCGLLVQCTSLGMIGHPPLDLPLGDLPRSAVVADLVYTPLETALLQAARARGNPTVDGLGMLLHQAVPGFAHWGGVAPVVDQAARQLLLNALAARNQP